MDIKDNNQNKDEEKPFNSQGTVSDSSTERLLGYGICDLSQILELGQIVWNSDQIVEDDKANLDVVCADSVLADELREEILYLSCEFEVW